MLCIETISSNVATVPMYVYIGEVVFNTSNHVPMHRNGTNWLDSMHNKRVYHYDVVMVYLMKMYALGSSHMHWEGV